LSQELQDLISSGIAELEKGNRSAAHRRFLKAVKLNPKDVTALAFAAGSSATKDAADVFLRRARAIAPDHPMISKGLEWSKTLPSKAEGKRTRVKQSRGDHRAKEGKREEKRGPKRRTWFVGLGITLLALSGALCVLLLLAGYFYYSQPDLQSTQVANIVQMTRSARIESSETMAVSSPTGTAKPTRSPTATLTLTPSVTPTATYTHTKTLQPTVVVYPEIDYFVFTSNPELYIGKTLSLTGRVISFGEVIMDEGVGFGIQIGPVVEESEEDAALEFPVLVLNLPPDPTIRLDDRITVYGRGGGDLGEIISQGLIWMGPVILGERILPSH
jgi:hypothetical protein